MTRNSAYSVTIHILLCEKRLLQILHIVNHLQLSNYLDLSINLFLSILCVYCARISTHTDTHIRAHASQIHTSKLAEVCS